MTTVAVTGVSGYLGRIVAERLAADPDITRVVGIDTVDPDYTTGSLEFYRMDVRSPQLLEAFSRCDAVVHLAAISSDDPDEVRDVNVGGTRAVADAATRNGVRKLVFASSHRVYGVHPDNDYPLTETSLVRPSHDDAYGLSKAESESVISYYAEEHPNTAAVALRLAWVCGPTIPTSHASVVDSKVRFVIEGYDPPFQAVHELDAAEAIAFAITHDVPSVLNVAATEALASADELLGQRRVTLGVARAGRMLDRTARLGLTPRAAHIGTLMYPQVLSSELLASAGCPLARSTERALRDAKEARQDWVALGRLHFRPKRIALVGGTLGAVLLGGAVRRRSAKRARASGSALPTPHTPQ